VVIQQARKKPDRLLKSAVSDLKSRSGPNWVEFLATTYNSSAYFDYNFADTGATIYPSIIAPLDPTDRSLVHQVNYNFLPAYGSKPATTNWTASNSLFAIFFGINDVALSYADGNTSRVDADFKMYTNVLQVV
jgi:hypothetical protein